MIFSARFNWTFVEGIKPHFSSGCGADALSVLFVAAGAGCGGFFEEEVEEFVADGEVGLLLELLEGG